MDIRRQQIKDLELYINEIDSKLKNILEDLQWDRKYLLENKNFVSCTHDSNHRILLESRDMHETKCILRSHGYRDDIKLLPDPPDKSSKTLVKLGNEDILRIINKSSNGQSVPSITGTEHQRLEPMTLERLQCLYSTDDRRAIHDAVVAAAPVCHDLSDLALLSTNDEEEKSTKSKSRLEVLAELRNMKRRRTKYRLAAKTRNYSDVLRDVIKTQMDTYTESRLELTAHRKVDTKARENGKTNNTVVKNLEQRDFPKQEQDEGDSNDDKESTENVKRNKHQENKRTLKKDSENYHKYKDDYAGKKRSSQEFRENSNKSKEGSNKDIKRNKYKDVVRYREKLKEDKSDCKDRNRDSRNFDKHTYKYNVEGTSRHTFREKNKDSRHDSDINKYREKDIKHKSHSRHRSKDRYSINEEGKKYQRYESNLKYNRRQKNEDKPQSKTEEYYRGKRDYPAERCQDVDKYKRYYDSFSPEDFNEKRRKK